MDASRPIWRNSKEHQRNILSYACSRYPEVVVRMSTLQPLILDAYMHGFAGVRTPLSLGHPQLP